jgi:hypothetical protein
MKFPAEWRVTENISSRAFLFVNFGRVETLVNISYILNFRFACGEIA